MGQAQSGPQQEYYGNYGYPPGHSPYAANGFGNPYSNYANPAAYGGMNGAPYPTQRKQARRTQTMPMYMPSMPVQSPPIGYPQQPGQMYGYPSAFPQMIYPVMSPPIDQDQAARLLRLGQNILGQGQQQQYPSTQMPPAAPPMSMPEPAVSQPGQEFPPSGNPGMMMPEPVIQAGADMGMPTPRPDGGAVYPQMGTGPVVPQQMPMPMPEPPVPNNNNDPALAANPLPNPPRDLGVPAHLLSDTAMTHSGTGVIPPNMSEEPLPNPLPQPIKDVYDDSRYRPLVVGSGYREEDAYPEDWFEHGRGGGGRHHREGSSLSRTFSKLNPFRPHSGHRRYATMPTPMPVPFAGGGNAPGMTPDVSQSSADTYSPAEDQQGRGWFSMSRRRNRGPPPGFVYMPEAQTSEERDAGPPIEFDRFSKVYSGFTHTSPHTILYKNKLYPTAMHLLEAHKFLGARNDLAERVRNTSGMAELHDVVDELGDFVRRDWEQILVNKMEDVLLLKFIQHVDLRNLLLNTGYSDLVFRDPTDPFWGTGSTQDGENWLGKALMSVRERLHREAAGR